MYEANGTRSGGSKPRSKSSGPQDVQGLAEDLANQVPPRHVGGLFELGIQQVPLGIETQPLDAVVGLLRQSDRPLSRANGTLVRDELD